jgi:uncharacterized protein YjeT (DUF2065 family)
MPDRNVDHGRSRLKRSFGMALMVVGGVVSVAGFFATIPGFGEGFLRIAGLIVMVAGVMILTQARRS